MRAGRPVLIVAGLIVAAVGLLFVGQGLGYVRWPASSFMIDQRAWVTRGSLVAAAGLALVVIGRRLRRGR